MKSFFVFFFAIIVYLYVCSCNSVEKKQQIIDADINFCKLAKNKGIAHAFISYADEDAIIMRENDFPLLGKIEISKYYKEKKFNSSILEWVPITAEISKSGELGYTFGNWKYFVNNQADPDTILYGNYITIWKKQSDDSWKYVFDGGSDTPKPR